MTILHHQDSKTPPRSIMKQNLLLLLSALACFVVLSSHDLFIKLKTFYLEPNTEARIAVYNGTFTRSEAILARERMNMIVLINPGEEVMRPADELWFEENNQTLLKISTGEEGTGVFGISTLPKVNDYTAESFAESLKHEGLTDLLADRKKSGKDKDPARKSYSKHVKAIFQVGTKRSDDYKTVLGFPIELVPINNPYLVKVGGELSMQLFINGKPAANEMVYASYGGQHGYDDSGMPTDAFRALTDSEGIVTAKVTRAGHWYFRTVNMVATSKKEADYESLSAAITFEIKE